MSSQNANESKQTKADKSEKTNEGYEKIWRNVKNIWLY